MNIPAFSIHGGGDASGGWLTVLDAVLGSLTNFLDQGGEGFQLFPGIAVLSTNVHPMIVHFPIALLTSYVLIDFYAAFRQHTPLRTVARWLLYLGALGALAAIATGLYAASIVPHGEQVHEIMETHMRFGLTIAALSVSLALMRRFAREPASTMGRSLQVILNGVLLVCLALGADLGGLMVYGYGVGVKGMTPADAEQHHHHHGADSE